ncbi:cytochrome P450 [Aspergillus karnatakaensis]|uniref:cytochrome P450 n=1 Tax=Aspergillus karnatakaensis TaxID=1810916 RepID=UPI003CCD5833
MSTVVSLEGKIQPVMNTLWQRFDEFAKRGEPINLSLWASYLTYDVVGTLCLSDPMGFIESGYDKDGFIGCIHGAFYWISNLGYLPLQSSWLTTSFTDLASRVLGLPLSRYSRAFGTFSVGKIIQRIQEGPKRTGDRDMLDHFVEMKDPQGAPAGIGDVLAEVGNLLAAGADTTSVAIKAVLGPLLQDPVRYKRLQMEIDAVPRTSNDSEDTHDPLSFNKIKDLPFLSACIKEGGRLHPSITYQLPRLAPADGLNIEGYYIPASATLSMSPLAQNRCRDIFGEDADVWNPERWIKDEGNSLEKIKEMEKQLATFGYGSRTCIGRNLATFEVYKFMAQLVSRESCKIRKVKCSGSHPCNRCQELRGECTYVEPPRQEAERRQSTRSNPVSRSAQSASPAQSSEQESPQSVMARATRVSEQRGTLLRPGSSLNRPPTSSLQLHLGRVIHPSHSMYRFNLARDVLKQRGLLVNPETRATGTTIATDGSSPVGDLITLLQAAQPLLELGHNRVSTLVSIFINEIYPLYPCINLELALPKVDALFRLLSQSQGDDATNIDLIDVEIMKATVAITQVSRGEIQNTLSQDLESHLVWNVNSTLVQEEAQLEDIIMAALMCIYLDLKNSPIKAWRMSGVAARLCLELGIHRESFYSVSEVQKVGVTCCRRIFACVYDLNMKSSFTTGLQWTMHDSDIDTELLDLGPQESYLSSTVALNRTLADIWELVNADSQPTMNRRDRAEFLSFQLQKLADKVPTQGFETLDPKIDMPAWLQTALKGVFDLRVMQARMLIHIGTFASVQEILAQPPATSRLIDLVRGSVDLHMEMMDAQIIRPLIYPILVALLLSQLSFLLLAVSYSPQDYGQLCSGPFHTAIYIFSQLYPWVTAPGSDSGSALRDLETIADQAQMPPLNVDSSGAGSIGTAAEWQPTGIEAEFFAANADFLNMLEGSDPTALGMMCVEGLSSAWPGSFAGLYGD